MMENYADPVDRASVEEQRILEQAIELARHKTSVVLPFIGQCYNCDEPLVPGHRFCDAECRDDHEKRARSRLHMPK